MAKAARTVQEYLQKAGITFRRDADGGGDGGGGGGIGLPAASVTAPDGWVEMDAAALPGARQVLAAVDRARDGWAPNAVLVDNTLVGSVDPDEFMTCAVADARRMPGWREAIARVEPVDAADTGAAGGAGGTRALIRGTYEADGKTVCVTTVYLLTEHAVGQNLAQLTVTIEAAAVDMLDGVDEMVAGLSITE